MLDNVLSFFGFGSGAAGGDQRRRHVRHDGRGVRVVIGDSAYPVHDWDTSGISFQTTPENYLKAGERVHMRIEFPLPHETVCVEQEAVIFRVAHRGVSAAQFTAVTPAARRQFERVLDALHTHEFLRSQVA
ncbi:MAG: hypothetical protein KGL10_06690 [Alphaproteobacteria bacterium]|nr:hypothetical protein [Alphaproteobacteria bacterium]MDE2336980.1 hypothetical protein [Alphaproteobacteria bacterium]